MNKEVALSLGGNLGDVEATFNSAVEQLKINGLSNIVLSTLYRTPPVGCAPETPDFVNAALTADTSLDIIELFNLCKKIEEEFGRPNDHERYASRTIDLDIIFYGQELIENERLTIPHKEAYNRLFVLVPLAEIAGAWNFPGKTMSVNELLESQKDCEEYRKIYQQVKPAIS